VGEEKAKKIKNKKVDERADIQPEAELQSRKGWSRGFP
jgi:hypothetical protein